MMIKKIYLSLAASLLFSSAVNAAVHCDDPQLWYQGWTGGGQQLPIEIHCSFVNDTNTNQHYHIQLHGYIIDNISGTQIGNGTQDYDINLSPNQAITNNYAVAFYVRYNHTGYFRSGLDVKISDADNFNKTWYGVVSVPY